ncbi:MAG TPA: GyrI-like domain-containing protein [Aggregatilineales bacterium]|nr:hypothetical protein [Chloroflexota bacterium]HOA25424.1 GyrI-like domain-containing protein [Aggregatilineales bacterium]HPV06816.1 GyrI-like domain-containing protein [Aggregatilineales bacterium]HQA68626.1 GyrI-like domain-containing protein [Aggregatilineales bacterium]HQE19187.1 GyrI-like domain-containing protein [Aggregatilineales bacterium]
MAKIDLKRELKHLYAPSAKEVAFVEVPPMQYLMVDGAGDPNTAPAYEEAVEALYAVAYAVKFAVKKADPARDYAVMPLEGLWWAEDMTAFNAERKGDWLWTMMIMQPEWVTAAIVEQAVAEAGRKKDLPALPKLRFETYDEGYSAQIMHIGPYSAEGPTIARLHAAIEEAGCALRGKHHEIYLGDPRRTAPEKLKTIIRQPVSRAE